MRTCANKCSEERGMLGVRVLLHRVGLLAELHAGGVLLLLLLPVALVDVPLHVVAGVHHLLAVGTGVLAAQVTRLHVTTEVATGRAVVAATAAHVRARRVPEDVVANGR